MNAHELLTPRLRLRRWCPEDKEPMPAINRDPEVARYLNRPVDEKAVEAFLGLVVEHWNKHGFGFWAIELRQSDAPNSAAWLPAAIDEGLAFERPQRVGSQR